MTSHKCMHRNILFKKGHIPHPTIDIIRTPQRNRPHISHTPAMDTPLLLQRCAKLPKELRDIIVDYHRRAWHKQNNEKWTTLMQHTLFTMNTHNTCMDKDVVFVDKRDCLISPGKITTCALETKHVRIRYEVGQYSLDRTTTEHLTAQYKHYSQYFEWSDSFHVCITHNSDKTKDIHFSTYLDDDVDEYRMGSLEKEHTVFNKEMTDMAIKVINKKRSQKNKLKYTHTYTSLSDYVQAALSFMTLHDAPHMQPWFKVFNIKQ